MTYAKETIKELKDYVLQQIKNNEAQARYLLREKELATANHSAVQTCLKENKMYFNILTILENTETID